MLDGEMDQIYFFSSYLLMVLRLGRQQVSIITSGFWKSGLAKASLAGYATDMLRCLAARIQSHNTNRILSDVHTDTNIRGQSTYFASM